LRNESIFPQIGLKYLPRVKYLQWIEYLFDFFLDADAFRGEFHRTCATWIKWKATAPETPGRRSWNRFRCQSGGV